MSEPKAQTIPSETFMAAESKVRWRIVHSEASLGWGGQERRILAELEGFRQRGSDVWLLAPSGAEVFHRAQAVSIACEAIDYSRWQFPFTVLKTAAWLRRVRPHVINTHSSRDGWLVGIAARMAQVPFIVRTRHFDVPISSRLISGFVYRRLADHVLTTSPKVTAHFQVLFHMSADRVTTLPTGIDLFKFSPHGDLAQLVPNVGQNPVPLVGMVSVIRLAKGHETMIAAASQLRAEGFAAHYVIVGDGPNLERVREKVRALQLGECVTFTGQRDDVPAVLRALSLLVIPSMHEGIPQTGMQALATKTPVVASDVGGIPSIIRPGETGRLVPPGDSTALARAIRDTLQNTAATKRMCEAGRALVEREHGVEGMLDKLELLYRRYLPDIVCCAIDQRKMV